MIKRNEIFAFTKKQYGVEPDYPWTRTPNYAIFRHNYNRKWFAAVIDITEDKLGLLSKKLIDSMLLKWAPLLVCSLRKEIGIYHAYHMNKEWWISMHLEQIARRNCSGV